jgi:tryptophan-rich sensory protein
MTFVVFLALVFAAGFSGARFRPDAWYRALRKPSWNPPDWIFGPVWTVLYIAIAVAGWRVWREGDGFTPALYFWIAQLVLNALWSYIYFGRHNLGGAVADSALMLVAIIGFLVTAAHVDVIAAWLFVPYLLWVGFATVLSFVIWRANRESRVDARPQPR